MTASACIQAITRISKLNRCAFSSPACGPEPVTSVPRTMTIKVNEIWISDSRDSIFSTPSRLRAGKLRLENRDVAAAIRIIERIR